MDKQQKRQLVTEYKNKPQNMGIFKVKNLVNGKIFIGSAKNLDGKFNSIKFQLKMGSHPVKALQKDWNQFGEENFGFEIIDRLEPDQAKDPLRNLNEDLQELEELWLEKLEPYGDKGYNPDKIKPKDLH